MQKYKIIVYRSFSSKSDSIRSMLTLLLAIGNQFRFLKAHILNITGLRPILTAYYIFDTGITFTCVNSTSTCIYNFLD